MPWLRRVVWMLLGTVLLTGQAQAQDMTLAVLPLDKASASEDYAGLGRALAGMLVTDLSAVPGITLVERARLQALLDEMELGAGEFVDPASAQELGQGLGAKFVLAGSFSVLGEQFVLDARVVSVESGKIYKAADAQGSIRDFVSVEKDLVESLLQGLAVSLSSSLRRQLYTATPTEDFVAFSAYGEGLERQRQGDLEAARAAYERAIAADPDFADARAALAGVKAAMVEYLAERNVKYDTAYRSMNLRVLEAFPDERSVSGAQVDIAGLTGFALRLSALENEGMDCQRMQEMQHYLERVDYRVSAPERLRGEDAQGRSYGVFSFEVDKLAGDLEFVRYESGAGGPVVARRPADRAGDLFGDVSHFLLNGEFLDVSRMEPESAYFSSVSRCMEPRAMLDEVDRVRAALSARELGGERPRSHDSITIDDHLEALWLIWSAKHLGSSEELGRRSERLLTRVQLSNPAGASEDQKELERWGLGILQDVVDAAKWRDRLNAQLYGLSPEQMAGFMKGFSELDLDVVVFDGPACVYFRDFQRSSIRGSYREYLDELEQEDWFWVHTELGRGGAIYASMKDLGCVVGAPPRYSSLSEMMPVMSGALDALQSKALDPEDNTCESLGMGFRASVKAYEQNLQYIAGTESEGPAMAGMMQSYHQLRIFGCL